MEKKIDQGKETWEWVGAVAFLRWPGQATGQNCSSPNSTPKNLIQRYQSRNIPILFKKQKGG